MHLGERGLVLVGGDADAGGDRAGGLGGGLVGGDARRQARHRDRRGDGLVHGLDGAAGGLVHDQVAAQHRESGVGALEAEVAGAVGVHHGVLGHQALLAAEAERLGQRTGLAVRQGDQAGPVLGGLGLDRGGGSGLGGGAHLDDAGEEGGGGEYGAGCERSLHVQVLPGNRVCAVAPRSGVPGLAP